MGYLPIILTMQLTITIPDELLPGLIALAYAESTPNLKLSPEDIAQRYALAAATKACQDMKVGPFFVGPTSPPFNADGTTYIPA